MSETAANLDGLISQAVGGDGSALESLLLHFHDPLLQSIQRSISRGASALITPEDVLQETFIEAFRRIRTFDHRGNAAFLNWLKNIARGRLVNQLKALKAQKRGGGRHHITSRNNPDAPATSIFNLIAAKDPTPSLMLRRKEAVNAVAAAIKTLDPTPRQAIELRFGQGMSIEQAAEKLGKSDAAMKMIINRAIKALRQILADNFGKSSTGT